MESHNHLGWKRLQRSSPALTPVLLSPPLNHILKHHISHFLKTFQARMLSELYVNGLLAYILLKGWTQ